MKEEKAIIEKAIKEADRIAHIESGAISCIGADIKEIIPCGTICLAYCAVDREIASRIERVITKEGYTVLKMCFESESDDELYSLDKLSADIRAYVGIGGMVICDKLQKVCYDKDAKFLYVSTRDVCVELFKQTALPPADTAGELRTDKEEFLERTTLKELNRQFSEIENEGIIYVSSKDEIKGADIYAKQFSRVSNAQQAITSGIPFSHQWAISGDIQGEQNGGVSLEKDSGGKSSDFSNCLRDNNGLEPNETQCVAKDKTNATSAKNRGINVLSDNAKHIAARNKVSNQTAKRSPHKVILDVQVLKYSERVLASAYGNLLSKYTALFESFFKLKISAYNNLLPFIRAAKQMLNDFFEGVDVRADDFAQKLFSVIVRLSVVGELSKEDFLQNAESVAAALAYDIDESLSRGEYCFLYGYFLPNYYFKILQFEGIDLQFPPDTLKSVKFLEKNRAVTIAEGIRLASEKGCCDYLKTQYLIEEFKQDFLDFLQPIVAKMPVYARNFRRIYSDAAYFLQDKITLARLMEILAASAIMIDKNSFLGYLKDCGYLERYFSSAA